VGSAKVVGLLMACGAEKAPVRDPDSVAVYADEIYAPDDRGRVASRRPGRAGRKNRKG
jgi:hypothetical protein